jgi:hypothetical protein
MRMKTEPNDAGEAWANLQDAVLGFWLGGLQPGGVARQARLCSRVRGIVGEAVCASTKAVLRMQVDLTRDWAESVATNPRSSKIVIEGAHQAYDLVVAFSEANAEYCNAWLAALRSLEPEQCAAPMGRAQNPGAPERESKPGSLERL